MPRGPATTPEQRETAIAAVLSGATLAAAGALVGGVNKGTVHRWVRDAQADLGLAVTNLEQRAQIGLSYLLAAEDARERLLEILADAGPAQIRDVAYALRVMASVGQELLGWRQDARQQVFVGGQHLHAGPAAPLGEVDDAELERRIAAAAALRDPAPQ